MKLVVGLGNPGSQYAGTRHNVGFEVAQRVARQQLAGPFRSQFESLVTDFRCGDEKVLLVMPQTYMNLSGRAVRRFVDYFDIACTDVLVICDDMNLPAGKLRLRGKGSAGGQKGLADILRALGTQDVPRLRIGIGRPPEFMDATAWVLGRFSEEERTALAPALERAAQAVPLWIREGLSHAMNVVNAPDDPAGRRPARSSRRNAQSDSATEADANTTDSPATAEAARKSARSHAERDRPSSAG
ncbi:MAG: aminoacyl-tRNA hydrolase [Planctomycetota bacterium]|nr:MAG: aminoacyl-tRNA hydrolase [Planctomycetota bacterium]